MRAIWSATAASAEVERQSVADDEAAVDRSDALEGAGGITARPQGLVALHTAFGPAGDDLRVRVARPGNGSLTSAHGKLLSGVSVGRWALAGG
jgi:hypothetical protein